jgi:hypothetical protein
VKRSLEDFRTFFRKAVWQRKKKGEGIESSKKCDTRDQTKRMLTHSS